MARAHLGLGVCLALLSCKSTSDQKLENFVVFQMDQKQRIYFTEQGLIKTALCTGKLPALEEQTPAVNVRSLCMDQITAGLTPEAFKSAMIELFKKTYHASELSAYEASSLDTIIAQISNEKTVLQGWEADHRLSDPFEIDSIWLQFMPFAAGVVAMRTPPAGPPVTGTVMQELSITLGQSQTEYEIKGASFAKPVNLFTVMAKSEKSSGLCPAYIDILSITQVREGQAAPVFGGAVVGGSRFLLNQPVQQITGMRLTINPAFESKDFQSGLRCKIAILSTSSSPSDLGLQVAVPNPVKLDARDQKMVELMAKPEVRAWHFLWHGVRNAWPRLAPAKREEIRSKLGPEWDLDKGGSGDVREKGEEFLQMHHMMMDALRQHLGSEMYDAWPQPPAPNDPLYGIPGYIDPVQKSYIDSAYQTMISLHKQASDPQFLRSLTLSQFGLWMEENLHNMMHQNWAHPKQWYFSYAPTMQEAISQPNRYPAYAHPSNNSLSGTYTSHVNPLFYRLHGYIDARLQGWLTAHGYDSISKACRADDRRCYTWKRTWDGQLPATIVDALKPHLHSVNPEQLGKLSEGVFRDIAQSSQMIPHLSDPPRTP